MPAPLTGDSTIEQANAALNIQITALTLQIQQLDNEIANGINSGATDEELQAKRDQQTALQAQLTTATANRDALTGYSDMANTLSTTHTALQNATVLLNARKNAESSLNSSTEELRKTLQSTISSLNDQLTKAQDNADPAQRPARQAADPTLAEPGETPPWTPPWPMWPCSCF